MPRCLVAFAPTRFTSAVIFCLWLAVSTQRIVLAQEASEVEELRELARALQQRLAALESSGTQRERVTDVGGNEAPVQPADSQVVRIYDVSDLFAITPPYFAQKESDLSIARTPMFSAATSQPSSAGLIGGGGLGGMGGMGGGGLGTGGMDGGGFFSVPDTAQPHRSQPAILPQFGDTDLAASATPVGTFDAARASLVDVIEAITTTISPDRWLESGGESTIAAVGTSLVINATPSMHQRIEALLTAFRQRWRTLRTVNIRADWLWLNDQELAVLLESSRPDAAADVTAVALSQDSSAVPMHIEGVIDEGVLEAWRAKLAEQSQEGQERLPGYRARISCFNGQTVHTLAGGQQLVISGMQPVVGGEDVGYQAQVSVIQEGAALQVTPMVSSGGHYVTLDIHSRVNMVRDNDQLQHSADTTNIPTVIATPQIVTPDQIATAIDRPSIVTQRLSTTTRLPVNQTMLVGGMSLESVPEFGDYELYLLVRVTTQELRDDIAKPAGLAP